MLWYKPLRHTALVVINYASELQNVAYGPIYNGISMLNHAKKKH